MRLGWYLRRLRNMSGGEIAHRVGEKAKKVRARGRLEGWDRYAQPDGAALPVLPGLAARLNEAPEALRARVAEAAGAVMDGHFAALGQEWPRFAFGDGDAGPDPLWHLDPVTGQHWPHERYCFDIGYRGAHGIGDVKYVWEFGRLQFLQPVAAHVALTGDPRGVDFLERAVASWQAANPPFRGVGWSSGIELALRAISLLVVTTLAGTRLSEETRSRIATILAAHAFWLERYPSRFSSANNHLVSEDAALFLIGVGCTFLPERQRERLVRHAATGLSREAGLQIHADGVPAEQSPTYGALTAELLLLCARVATARGEPLAAPLDERLAAYAGFVRWIADPTGRVPAIGDDDEGRVLTLAGHETRYPASVTAAIAGHLGRDELVLPHEPDLRNLLIPAGTAPASPLVGTHSFPDGGYTVHRGAVAGHDTLLVVDHAPLGYLSIAAHGHADALAVTLDVDGQPVLVDPGTYLYHSGHEWRDWFRGTRAHNTLTLAGTDQSRIAGAFNWSSKAVAKLESLTPAPFAFTGSHNGYAGLGATHRRTIGERPWGYAIRDAVTGAAPGTPIELVFQLAPDCDAAVDGQAVQVIRGGRAVLRIVSPDGGAVTVSRGGDAPDGGWVSPCFGRRIAAPRIVWTGAAGSAETPLDTELRLIED